MSSNFIIVVDVGTSNLKCQLLTNQLESKYEKHSRLRINSSSEGFVEINPDTLWTSIVSIVNDCLKEADVDIRRVASFGISCHRASFITWDKNTGVPYHDFVTWKDTRAENEIHKLNNNIFFRVFRWLAYFLYLVSGSPRYLTASTFKFTNAQVICRLAWVLKNNTLLKRAVQNGDAMFGTLDTWLLYRLTDGKTYCTDFSMASSTGLFDPYTATWNKLMKFIGIPISLMPDIKETAGYHFGEVSPNIWGASVPITCSIADQAAALYGSKCFKPGELKITLGTGAFLDINVGRKAVACKTEGLYPLVCWKYEAQLAYALEAACNDCGTVIDWLIASDFCSNVEELNVIANSVQSTAEVYFVPAFSELRMMSADNVITGSDFVSTNKNNEKEHLIKAVLESIVFRIYDIYKLCEGETNLIATRPIKVDGGVSNSDYICQALSNICQKIVRRPKNTEMSILGVASLASQVLSSNSSEFNHCDIDEDNFFQIFQPNEIDGYSLRRKHKEWHEAISKSPQWLGR